MKQQRMSSAPGAGKRTVQLKPKVSAYVGAINVGLVKVPTNALKDVFKSRGGLYKFFTENQNLHLPVQKDCTIGRFFF